MLEVYSWFQCARMPLLGCILCSHRTSRRSTAYNIKFTKVWKSEQLQKHFPTQKIHDGTAFELCRALISRYNFGCHSSSEKPFSITFFLWFASRHRSHHLVTATVGSCYRYCYQLRQFADTANMLVHVKIRRFTLHSIQMLRPRALRRGN